MKKYVFLLIWSMALLGGLGEARPVDLSEPSGEVGAANPKGYLEIWREIDGVGIQLGNSYLPFRYKFSSDPSTNGILGPGFNVPMFEATNVQVRETTMRCYLPCGKALYMWRTTTDPNKFESVDKVWTGYQIGDDFVVWRDDGWKLVYHKSRLSSITTDDNRTFVWSYTPSGFPQNISEKGEPIITVEPNAAGQVAAFIFGSSRYEADYGTRPLTQVLMGQVAVKELDQALSSFKYPDGTTDTFHFTLMPDRIPTLTFADRDKSQTTYSWNPTTNYIISEKSDKGSWTYTIGQATQDFGLPPISRVSDQGATESMAVDTQLGTYVAQASDGTKTITHIFKTPGPLYNKVREVEEVRHVDGKDITIPTLRAAYDENGRLIRKIDEKGYITNYSYDQGGKLLKTSFSQTAELASELAKKESDLLAQITKASSITQKQTLLESLSDFYIFEQKDPSKALKLLPQINPQSWYINRVQAIDYDLNLSPSQKIAGYEALLKDFPDRKKSLDFLIEARKEEENEQQN